MQHLARQITAKTKLVAVGYASNAVGTINDVKEVVRLAHQVGAATSWPAPPTSSLAHIWACCTENAST